MRSGVRSSLLCKMVLMWASAWMLAVPLFHVHPDAVHHHGEAEHIHGPIVHTVLSGDIEGEFDRNHEAHDSGGTAQDRASILTYDPHRWDEHSEFSVSLFSDSTDRKSLKLCPAPVLIIAAAPGPGTEPHGRITKHCSSPPHSHLFSQSLRSRAPPSLLL